MDQRDLDYLEKYDASIYQHPSVTVDILVFTAELGGNLEILLIDRDMPPFENMPAIPGGFVDMDESLEDAARRKLLDETGVSDIEIEQLYTFGAVDRDPRTRVISVAYFALIPKNKIVIPEGHKARWYPVHLENGAAPEEVIVGDHLELAFDHQKIIGTAIERLRGKLFYTDVAFRMLKDPNRFAIYELQKIYEAILGQKQDTANFRRMFLNTYVSKGEAEATGETCYEYSKRASQYYRKK